MAKWWSKSRAGFFDDAIHGVKGAKGSKIPRDAVEVSDETHDALMAAQAEGERIFAAEDGAPVSGTPTLSPAEILAQLRMRRDRDLAGSDWTQMGDNGLGDAARAAWAVYRQALRDYIALVEAAIAGDEDPYGVPYPTPPQIQAPPVPPTPPPPEGFPEPDNVGEN